MSFWKRSKKREPASAPADSGKVQRARAIAEYVTHYHDERSHQGIGNEIVSGVEPQRIGRVEVSERLGGLLNYYHRKAA